MRGSKNENKKISYTYDFGDGWQHDIIFEKEKAVVAKERYPLCLDGENNCPPEDVGGVGGFAEYKKAIKDKSHSMHQEYMNWRGPYNPRAFSVAIANLKMLRKKIAKNLKLKNFDSL